MAIGLRPGPRALGGEQDDPSHTGGLGLVEDGLRVLSGDQQEQGAGSSSALRRLAGSARSAWLCRTPSGSGAGCRETAVTCSPAAASIRTSSRPTFPVAPVTTIMELPLK